MSANTSVVAGSLVLCLGAQPGHAGPVGPLTAFFAGTAAKASEVNGNFSAVKTAVDDNASRISTLEGVNAASRLNTLETTVTPAGNILLLPSTATAGNILKGAVRFIHNFGTDNTFVGLNAGNFTTTGIDNTAIGAQALQSSTAGGNNTACGSGALRLNTTGNFNTASGWGSLENNTSGSGNTASGVLAMNANSNGIENTATGSQALRNNTSGQFNTATGRNSLAGNTIGSSNTAAGATALSSNNSGSNNTAYGANALLQNTTGTGNIAVGFQAGSSLTTGNSNIAIGNVGATGEAETIRIGSSQTRAFIAGIRNVTTATAAIAVVVGTDGQLGTLSSSRHVKDDIADMGEASATLMKLRPVTFHYKTDRNPEGRTLQYGLVAEEVAKVAPGLVARSPNGEIETVYHQFLAPMLLNEFQRQHRTIEAQEDRIARLEEDRRTQTARIEALEARIAAIANGENAALASAPRR